jgi:3-deoxy-manno-octulosonate cytidylyltransferase (CMP-KDO synthetase)
MNFIGIIPARYESTRFPGKPLVDIKGKPMIEWVYTNAQKALQHVWVATDDKRIFNAVINFGGNAVMTSVTHKSGTDRCAEAARIIGEEMSVDVIINIQGDEPFVHSDQIEQLKLCFSVPTDIATLVKKIDTQEELHNTNRPKVVLDKNGFALYFSRSTIPFIRNNNTNWLKEHDFWSHIGMYAYRAEVLQKLTKLPFGILEKAESLEQLRWLENGFKIMTAPTTHKSIGIDTPEDLDRALQLL